MLTVEDLEAHHAYLEGEVARVTQVRDAHQQGLAEASYKLVELGAQAGLIRTLLTQAQMAAAPKE